MVTLCVCSECQLVDELCNTSQSAAYQYAAVVTQYQQFEYPELILFYAKYSSDYILTCWWLLNIEVWNETSEFLLQICEAFLFIFIDYSDAFRHYLNVSVTYGTVWSTWLQCCHLHGIWPRIFWWQILVGLNTTEMSFWISFMQKL
jgi:hypothetical protein